MSVTITTGTTLPTTVLVEGDDVSANASEVYVWEQTASGTPTSSNSILLGGAVAEFW
jgi:hypothetical protein